ncbi:MAG: ligand-binding sensor domain-containing protein [Candidatus Latescibacterota bacterium]
MNRFKTILLLSAISLCTSLSAGAKGSWTNFTNTNHIMDIDFQGPYVWCATVGGVVRWDTRDMSCRVFGTEDGLPDYSATTIAVSGDGSVFAGTMKDAARFDGSRWSRIPLEEEDKDLRMVYALASAPDGTVWATGWGSSACRWKNGAWEHFPDTWGEGIAFASDGAVWIGRTDGLTKYNGTTWTKYILNPAESNQAGDPAIDPEGNIWLAKPNRLYRFDGSAWTVFPLPDTFIAYRGLEFDRRGVLWLGTNKGVYRFKDGFLPPYTESDGLPDEMVNALRIAPDGTVWAGTARGLARFDGERWTVFRTDCLLPGDGSSRVLVMPDDTLWVGTAYGIARYFRGKWTVYTEKDGLMKNWIMSISLAPDGSIWAGSFGGVSRFDGEKWTPFPMDDGSWLLANVYYIPLIAPDGSVWTNTPTGVRTYRNGEWTSITQADGLPKSIHGMTVGRDGVVWLGTYTGVTRYDGKSWKLYTVADGLPSNRIEGLLTDANGYVWAQTHEGLARFHDGKWEIFLKVL